METSLFKRGHYWNVVVSLPEDYWPDIYHDVDTEGSLRRRGRRRTSGNDLTGYSLRRPCLVVCQEQIHLRLGIVIA